MAGFIRHRYHQDRGAHCLEALNELTVLWVACLITGHLIPQRPGQLEVLGLGIMYTCAANVFVNLVALGAGTVSGAIFEFWRLLRNYCKEKDRKRRVFGTQFLRHFIRVDYVQSQKVADLPLVKRLQGEYAAVLYI